MNVLKLRILKLRDETGVGLRLCKEAIDYANGDYELEKAYIKAKTLAVATPKLTFDERVMLFKDDK